ncbi:MAG: thioredoxin [Spirochaetales bacterium]|jgi:thioredoxin 1|nr:thioredoxin [Spirochaetales bacterium]
MGNEITLTKDNFDAEVLKSGVPVLVDFWAPWCGPCKMIAPALESMSVDFGGKLKIGKINVDEEAELAVEFGIDSIPTLLVFHKGETVTRQIGLAPREALENLVKPYLS